MTWCVISEENKIAKGIILTNFKESQLILLHVELAQVFSTKKIFFFYQPQHFHELFEQFFPLYELKISNYSTKISSKMNVEKEITLFRRKTYQLEGTSTDSPSCWACSNIWHEKIFHREYGHIGCAPCSATVRGWTELDLKKTRRIYIFFIFLLKLQKSLKVHN